MSETQAPTPALAQGEEWVWVPFDVEARYDGLRVDQFLSQRLVSYSRSQVQKILAESRVLNGARPVRPSAKVHTGDRVTVAYPRRPEAPLAPDASIPILYEDDHLLAVNKPALLLSHPTDKVVRHTVLGVLRHCRPDVPSLHLLHRLDRETSGVLVLGKSPEAARRWTSAMERHEVQKEYVALVRGVPSPREGRIDAPIGNEAGTIKVRQWVNVAGAVPAVTDYRVERDFERGGLSASLVTAWPKTGRMHQIRVHLASVGHPLLGDPLYTGDGAIYRKMVARSVTEEDRASLDFPRVALHAAAIRFKHPITKAPCCIQAAWPDDFASFLR